MIQELTDHLTTVDAVRRSLNSGIEEAVVVLDQSVQEFQARVSRMLSHGTKVK